MSLVDALSKNETFSGSLNLAGNNLSDLVSSFDFIRHLFTSNKQFNDPIQSASLNWSSKETAE
jgi:hypothetical protein